MSDRKEEISNFSEEVLGVNLRSFRTVRDLIIRPNKVFQDFQDRKGNYTPTLRLALFFTGLMIASYYFVGGLEKTMVELTDQASNNFQNLYEKHGEAVIKDWLGKTYSYSIVATPIMMVLSAIPMVWILKLFNSRPTLTTRINLVFGSIVVATIAGFFAQFAYIFGWVSSSLYLTLLFVVPMAALLITFYRGGKGLMFDSKPEGLAVSSAYTILYVGLQIFLYTILLIPLMVITAHQVFG